MDATSRLDELLEDEELGETFQDAMDDLVIESCLQTASNINNEGISGQLAYLRECMPDREIARYIGLPFITDKLLDPR
jgi:hypothetical protein